MRKFIKSFYPGLLIVLICISTLSAPGGRKICQAAPKKNASAARPSTSGRLKVKGAQLSDKKGNPVQLRGISTHGIAWYPGYINQKCFSNISSWGANVVRLAMYTSEYGGYCNGGDKKQLEKYITDGVKYASKADMYVIIDWHILSDGNPNTHKSEALKFFRKMSKKFSKNNNVIYEICNEPNGGTTWKNIKSYAKPVISAIRKNDKNAVIIVGTPNWSQYVDQAAASPLKGYKNIMYSLHFYAATHKGDLRRTMTKAVEKGLPVFVTEYGICDASGSGNLDKSSAAKWIKTLDDYGISYVAWNLSNKNETSSLIRSNVAKTSGLRRSDLSDSGKWLYDLLKNTGSKPSSTAKKLAGSTSAASPAAAAKKKPSSPAAAKKDTSSKTGSGSETSLGGNNLKVFAKLANSWESDGLYFYQYTLTVKNVSAKNATTWSADVNFDRTFSCSSAWGCNYTVKNKTIHVTPLDYNCQLAPQAQVTDIGFIISGKAPLHVR